jgi:hypothetical protein
MNLWHDLDPGPSVPDVIHTIVEIPKGSRNKYEYHNNTFAKMKWKTIGFCRRVGLSQHRPTQKDNSRCLPFYHSCSVSNRRSA